MRCFETCNMYVGIHNSFNSNSRLHLVLKWNETLGNFHFQTLESTEQGQGLLTVSYLKPVISLFILTLTNDFSINSPSSLLGKYVKFFRLFLVWPPWLSSPGPALIYEFSASTMLPEVNTLYIQERLCCPSVIVPPGYFKSSSLKRHHSACFHLGLGKLSLCQGIILALGYNKRVGYNWGREWAN